jgi:hypothetical protein
MPSVRRRSRDSKASTDEDSVGAEEPEIGDAPPPSLIADGYNQTYVVRSVEAGDLTSDTSVVRDVMFRCGNWCYSGEVSFAGLGDSITLKDIPRVIPILQRQQGRLKFYCCASAVPRDSAYHAPLRLLAEAQEFVAAELSGEHATNELEKWSKVFPWIDGELSKSAGAVGCSTYFEMKAAPCAAMKGITLVASKTYARGLIFITVYFEGSFYVVMQDGEGDQALLDIRFPDVSAHGQGLLIQTYADEALPWRKLTLWHGVIGGPGRGGSTASSSSSTAAAAAAAALRPSDVRSLSSSSYVQTYVVMLPNRGGSDAGANARYRDVLFRFGSWCYGGTVQLTPQLSLADIPHVIPALRMQQSRLDFVFDVGAVPARSPYARPLAYLQRVLPIMEQEIVASEGVLTELLSKLADMGLADSISSWFEGDAMQSFFEFSLAGGGSSAAAAAAAGDDSSEEPEEDVEAVFKGVDLVASKCYTPQVSFTVCV